MDRRPKKSNCQVKGYNITEDNIAAIKQVAVSLNPRIPKDSQAVRELLRLGFKSFKQLQAQESSTSKNEPCHSVTSAIAG